jgi:hypothetical protein
MFLKGRAHTNGGSLFDKDIVPHSGKENMNNIVEKLNKKLLEAIGKSFKALT